MYDILSFTGDHTFSDKAPVVTITLICPICNDEQPLHLGGTIAIIIGDRSNAKRFGCDRGHEFEIEWSYDTTRTDLSFRVIDSMDVPIQEIIDYEPDRSMPASEYISAATPHGLFEEEGE